MKRVRSDSSQQTKDLDRKMKKYCHRCEFCGVEFPSNCFNRGRALGSHVPTCLKRQEKAACCEEEIDGIDVVDGDVYGDFGEQDDEDRVELDEQIHSDSEESDDIDVVGDCFEGEEKDNHFVYCEPDAQRSFEEELALIEASKSESAGGGGVVISHQREMLNCVNFEVNTSAVEPVSRVQSNVKDFWFTEDMYSNRHVLASDYFCTDVVGASKLSRRAPTQLPKPDTSIFEYQMEMVDAYFTPCEDGRTPFKTNKKKGVDKGWRNCSALYSFAATHRLMSRKAGFDMLALIKTLAGNVGVLIPLHENWKNLVGAVEKHLTSFHPLHRLSWWLPKWLFGAKDAREKPLKAAVSVSFDLMKTIGLKLLLVNPKEFVFGPPLPVQPRVISGFHTSDVFNPESYQGLIRPCLLRGLIKEPY